MKCPAAGSSWVRIGLQAPFGLCLIRVQELCARGNSLRLRLRSSWHRRACRHSKRRHQKPISSMSRAGNPCCPCRPAANPYWSIVIGRGQAMPAALSSSRNWQASALNGSYAESVKMG